MAWSEAIGDIFKAVKARRVPAGGIAPEEIATALYRGILGRDPDLPGLAQKAEILRSGEVLEHIVRSFVDSPEFRARFLATVVPTVELPDLVAAMPDKYQQQIVADAPMTVYVARDDADMAAMAGLIEKHRFYDRFGVWLPVIDLDKQITAAIVRGLGATSCFELGCFTGPVLSLLADAGVDIVGAEVSHLAFIFAYPNVRDAMLFGDLLGLSVPRRFDMVLCMDVLEHVNPLLLDRYIDKLVSLLAPSGFLYLNAPMWGRDPIFGLFEEPYLAEWHAVGDDANWRHWPCDERGWPIHGHLVWASSPWWEQKFVEHGLVRDTVIESAIHGVLSPVFESARGRKCLFVLRRPDWAGSSEETARRVAETIRQVPGLPST